MTGPAADYLTLQSKLFATLENSDSHTTASITERHKQIESARSSACSTDQMGALATKTRKETADERQALLAKLQDLMTSSV